MCKARWYQSHFPTNNRKTLIHAPYLRNKTIILPVVPVYHLMTEGVQRWNAEENGKGYNRTSWTEHVTRTDEKKLLGRP